VQRFGPLRPLDLRRIAEEALEAMGLQAAWPALDIALLGGFAVRRDGRRVDDGAWGRRVAQRLVRYLLVHHGRAVPDDLLLEALWPGKPVESSRLGLRVAVSCARGVLDRPGGPSAIERTERTLALRLTGRDSVDAERFEAAAAAGLAAAGPRRLGLLERAAAQWTGQPLPEERYAEWAHAWREDLCLRYAEVLTALVAAREAEGDRLAAARAATRLVELDPLDEGAQRTLIACYARCGWRGHALRQYLECRRRLIDDLGVEPARQTSDLQRRVLAGEPV
jgi:DNA-binding SARP family transcriptional activator